MSDRINHYLASAAGIGGMREDSYGSDVSDEDPRSDIQRLTTLDVDSNSALASAVRKNLQADYSETRADVQPGPLQRQIEQTAAERLRNQEARNNYVSPIILPLQASGKVEQLALRRAASNQQVQASGKVEQLALRRAASNQQVQAKNKPRDHLAGPQPPPRREQAQAHNFSAAKLQHSAIHRVQQQQQTPMPLHASSQPTAQLMQSQHQAQHVYFQHQAQMSQQQQQQHYRVRQAAQAPTQAIYSGQHHYHFHQPVAVHTMAARGHGHVIRYI
jgi:hypothetical protein